MEKVLIATLADDDHPGGRITVEEWGGNLVVSRSQAIGAGLSDSTHITLRPEQEAALLAALSQRAASTSVHHTITVKVPMLTLSNRQLETVDRATDELASIPGVTLTGWGDDEDWR